MKTPSLSPAGLHQHPHPCLPPETASLPGPVSLSRESDSGPQWKRYGWRSGGAVGPQGRSRRSLSFVYLGLQAWFVGWPLLDGNAKMGPWKADEAGGGGAAVSREETGL